MRELDEAFTLTEMVQDMFEDSRIGSNKQHQLAYISVSGSTQMGNIGILHSGRLLQKGDTPGIGG